MKIRSIFLVLSVLVLSVFNASAQVITYRNCLYQNISKQNDEVIDESKVDVKIIWKSLTGSVYDLQDIEYKGVSIRFQTPTNQFNVKEYSSFFTQGIDNHGGLPYITIMKRKLDNQLLFIIEYQHKDKIKLFVDINDKKNPIDKTTQSISKESNSNSESAAPVKKVVVPVKKTTVTAHPAKPSKETAGNTKVKITTDLGVIVVRLYDSTPKHRDNFVKLVKENFYDSLLFHRIIQGFMIQGGDPMSKNAAPGTMLGMGGGDMTRIPAEFNRNLIHKKGALAAARDGNPEKASSACQFYIVQGNPMPEEQLKMMSQQKGYAYTPEQINSYKTIGGTPFLDMDYTVFGEIVSGMEVLDKIAAVAKDQSDRPKTDVKMKMELIK